MTIDELKRLDLVALLTQAWGMSFDRDGASFVALSPFGEESTPSFYVARAGDGHWVYCDHSAGSSGSIIDLMMRKLRTDDVARGCDEARRLACATGVDPAAAPVSTPPAAGPEPDWEWLHRRLRSVDASPCRKYLIDREIDEDLVDGLIARGTIVLNRTDGCQYCCFAIRDFRGALLSLFNRRIDGASERDKFVLGRQAPFCMDWDALAEADSVYLCEGIIDALSVLTPRPAANAIALPGANADPSQLRLPVGARLIEAFDADRAGREAADRLRRHFPDRTIESFDLLGAADFNEYLQRRGWMSDPVKAAAKLSVQDRIDIALSDRPSRELARRYGVHHSRICDIRNEASTILKDVWAARRPGRKPKPQPSEQEIGDDPESKDLRRKLDLLTMRKEWLDLQLEMHEKRDAEVECGQTRKKRKKKRPKKLRRS